MAAGKELLLGARQDMADDGEPLLTRTRSVQNYGSGQTLYINPTAEAAEIIGFGQEDSLRVDVYPDRIELRPSEGAEDA